MDVASLLFLLLSMCNDVTERFVIQISRCVDVGGLEHLTHLSLKHNTGCVCVDMTLKHKYVTNITDDHHCVLPLLH